LIGHEGHDEVIGTMGEAPERMILVETAEDVEKLTINPEKMAYLTQTTLSVDDANVVIDALRKKFPQIANHRRTTSVTHTKPPRSRSRTRGRGRSRLVLGSQNSSNSKRLAEIAGLLGPHAHLIDGVKEIRPEWFKGSKTS